MENNNEGKRAGVAPLPKPWKRPFPESLNAISISIPRLMWLEQGDRSPSIT